MLSQVSKLWTLNDDPLGVNTAEAQSVGDQLTASRGRDSVEFADAHWLNRRDCAIIAPRVRRAGAKGRQENESMVNGPKPA